MAFETHSSRFFETTVLGYEPNTVLNLVRILFPLPLTFFVAWVTITMLMNIFISNKRQKNQNIKIKGIINDISYSDARINNKPMFKVIVTYNKHVRTFDHINSNVQLKLNEGDEVIIYYEENNINNAFLDIDSSLDLKTSHSDLKTNANFKIIEVIPAIDNEKDLYEIIGTVYRINHKPTQASIKERIPSHQISSFIPQKIIPCIITENSKDNIIISMIMG